MRVLGIETTCDETAAAIVSVERSGEVKILSNEVLSQIAAHAAYGGVVPEIAARAHVEAMVGFWNAGVPTLEYGNNIRQVAFDAGVAKACELLKAAGAKRALPLAVSALVGFLREAMAPGF